MSRRPLWRPLLGDEYKSCWVACTGDREKAGVWAHIERRDGLTLCGYFHKPEDFPLSVTIADVKAAHAKRAAEIARLPPPPPVAPWVTITLTVEIS